MMADCNEPTPPQPESKPEESCKHTDESTEKSEGKEEKFDVLGKEACEIRFK